MWRGSGRRGEHAHDHADVPLAQTGVTAACACTFDSSGVSHATLTRVLVVWLCAAFGIGNAITKACPPDLVRLDHAAACLFAANAARKTYTVVESSYYLSGCYWHAFTDRVYYNVYSGTVQNESYAQPLCAGAAGNPTRTRSRRHAVSARAQALNRTRRRKCGHADADASACAAPSSKQAHARLHKPTHACTPPPPPPPPPPSSQHRFWLGIPCDCGNSLAGAAATATPPTFSPPNGTSGMRSMRRA
jgi:hypothetical protein